MMNDQQQAELDVAGRIEALARPVVTSMGLELVEAVYRGGFPGGLLRVTIDKPGGVSLEDCEAVSRVVGTQIDVEGLLADAYTLEVSSPGLDRRLKRPEDYGKYQGRLAKVKTAGRLLVGRLEGLTDGHVVIRSDDGEVQQVPVQEVLETRLVVEFGAARPGAGRERTGRPR